MTTQAASDQTYAVGVLNPYWNTVVFVKGIGRTGNIGMTSFAEPRETLADALLMTREDALNVLLEMPPHGFLMPCTKEEQEQMRHTMAGGLVS